ncbi:MAG: excinuclease ABC subunit UvrC [Bacteroidia bacterium]
MKNAPDKLAEQLRSLPDSPGVYQYFDEEGKILYVGKAINLRKRVLSYFVKNHDRAKTAMLVRRIADIKYIIVETELDALLLENNLIKKYQPRYNVALKDDKTFPWICIKNERFPRVFHTRRLLRDGSRYFGPYANVKMMHALLDLIHKLYPTRNCNLSLHQESIEKKKFKVCLEYHIGNCKGPCEGHQSEEEYNDSIARMEEIIRGNFAEPLKHLKEQMLLHAGKMEFEKAQAIKEKADILENYRSRSTVVSPSITNVDVCSIASDEDTAFVNYLKVMNGAIVLGHTIELRKKIEENQEELLQIAIAEFRNRFQSDSKEIIVQFSPGIEIPGVEFVIPQRGDKKKLLDLSARNVEYYRKEKQRQQSLVDPERHTRRILATMMKDLRLQSEPRHIECFDNSNIQGAYPVAAMTVFKDTRPSKKDYRHFNIRTVEGPDDFASMEEVIYRRYRRLQEEGGELPQLIVIDGGKGQLSAALHSLEKLGLRGKIGIIGIAKRLEEIYYPGDSMPMYLDKKSETLRIIQQIRDEAHRFGITHHRKRREKGTIKTELTGIKGISHTSAQTLLRVFKSVKQVKEASAEALIKVLGKAKGMLVFRHFHPSDSPKEAESPTP